MEYFIVTRPNKSKFGFRSRNDNNDINEIVKDLKLQDGTRVALITDNAAYEWKIIDGTLKSCNRGHHQVASI